VRRRRVRCLRRGKGCRRLWWRPLNGRAFYRCRRRMKRRQESAGRCQNPREERERTRVRTAATRGVGATPTGRLACPFVAVKAMLRRFGRASLTRRTRHSPPHFSLWSGDGLGAPGTALSRVGLATPRLASRCGAGMGSGCRARTEPRRTEEGFGARD
jgi:hypothetical protein